jgi:hypothetical protein
MHLTIDSQQEQNNKAINQNPPNLNTNHNQVYMTTSYL